MMSDENKGPEQSLTQRFTELWGAQASGVVLLGNVIRVAEDAIFEEDLGTELKKIRDLVDEGLSALGDEEEKPEPGFGFSKE